MAPRESGTRDPLPAPDSSCWNAQDPQTCSPLPAGALLGGLRDPGGFVPTAVTSVGLAKCVYNIDRIQTLKIQIRGDF